MLMTECSAYIQIDIAKIKSTSNTIKDIRIWLPLTLSYQGSTWKQRIFAIQQDFKVQSTKYATSDRKTFQNTLSVGIAFSRWPIWDSTSDSDLVLGYHHPVHWNTWSWKSSRIKAKAIGRQLVKSEKNNQDVKLIEVVQCSVRDCSSPCPGDLVVAYFVTHAAGKLSRLIDYQEEE